MTFKQSSQAGFTILETMVAVAILVIAITGPLSTIGSALGQIYIVRDQMIAINLAQEGVEAVRQVRDSKLLEHWTTHTSPFNTIPDGGYYLDSNFELKSCAATACTAEAPIYKKSDSSYYQDTSIGTGISTNFTRVITVEAINTSEKKVTSKVVWRTSGGAFKDITVVEYLFAINETIPTP